MNKILVLIIFSLLGYNNVFACSCKKEKTIKDAFEYHESIVHGKVLNKTLVTVGSTIKKEKLDSLNEVYQKDNNKLKSLSYKSILKVEVEVMREFKGKLESNIITIFTNKYGSACGYTRFEVGKEFLIYGSTKSYMYHSFQRRGKYINYELENTFWTSHCYRTKEYLESEAQELKKIMD
ncbi:hypothetical protein [uncultured Aquimarina sp.]|uniref:hypothetical protein n=1 Tax=uncultured Aquimarina sp. TaxID=575652 RepID=UPI00260E3AF2|nr:hypothetical protein [uncultured Aquimarina sp.]